MPYTGTEHLLLGLAADPGCKGTRALRLMPATGTGLTLGVCAAGAVAGRAPAAAIVASGWVVQSIALA